MGLRRNGVAKAIVEKQMGVTTEPDDEYLYGTFNESVRNNQKLANKAAHKALNLPMDDDMQINNTDNRVVNNYGSKMGGLAKLAAGGLLLASGAGAATAIPFLVDAFINRPQPTPAPVTDTDTDTQYEIGLEP